MATTEQFSLRWNNFHSNLTAGFHELLEASEMVDVTLAVEGHFFQAHKVVLSICSPYFKQMFKVNPCKHPIVILKDVAHDNMKDILEFMYMGEVNVLRENLTAFLRTAELLQVKGLTGDDSSETSSRKDDKSDSLADNDEEPDLMQFNQMIDSDVDLPPHYSTPRVPTPPPVTPNPTPLTNSKRQSKTPHSNSNCKRTKSDQNTKSTENVNAKTNLDETEYSESQMMKFEKTPPSDLDDNKDNLKQILENSLGTQGVTDANASEQAGHLQQEFRAAQYRGLPLPILWVMDYFVIDGEGFRFGRFYRTAGWYSHIVLWCAFVCWLLAVILFRSVIRYGAYCLGTCGILQLFANLLWLVIRNPLPLSIPFEDDTITTKFGGSYWLTFINGIACVAISIAIIVMDFVFDNHLYNFFNVDPLNSYDEVAYLTKEQLQLRNKKTRDIPLITMSQSENEDDQAEYIPVYIKSRQRLTTAPPVIRSNKPRRLMI